MTDSEEMMEKMAAAGGPPEKGSYLEKAYNEMLKHKMQANQITAIPPLMMQAGQITGGVTLKPHDILRIERTAPQKLIITMEKIDNGFVVVAFEDKQDSGVSQELFKSFIEDPTNLGEDAIKALAIAGLSK